MARHIVSRPDGEVHLQAPIPHNEWRRDLLTGILRLSLETPPGQVVSPGTGRLTLSKLDATETVAQQAATVQGVPVLPGAGIKGAVRSLFEILSFSCDLFAWTDRSRGYDRSPRCSPRFCCDACSLFGLLGWNGRVGFDDALPVDPAAVQIEVQKVPIPWTPSPMKSQGQFRLYDSTEATQPDVDRKVYVRKPKELAREVFSGRFEARMRFCNLTPEEMGRLLLSMGIGSDERTSFYLRLGGLKYDGKGLVKVEPNSLRLTTPLRRDLLALECSRQCSAWIESARASSWADTFWPTLEKVAEVLQRIK